MEWYMIEVGLLRACVCFLLLMGTACICAAAWNPIRLIWAALSGGIYAFICLWPGMDFLGNMVLYFLMLICMGIIAFGKQPLALYEICIFVLINLMMDVILSDKKGMLYGLIIIFAIFAICMLFFRGGRGGLVPIQLTHKGKTMSLMALRDTGNMLRDPITGKSVLVVSPEIAHGLLGLSIEQLRKPIESIGSQPGLRLIPYKTIGQQGAMMLAMRLQEVKIGLRKGSGLVAFAPESIGSGASYQALTGG